MRATKKLLSVLLAVAMVLSMVPAVVLFAGAETVHAEITKGEAVAQKSEEVKDAFAGATGEVTAVCPACAANGDTAEKSWTAVKADIAIKDKASVVAMGGGHFYFAEDLVKDYSYILGGFFSGSGCLNLNGKTVTLNGGKLVELTAGNTMNIMDIAGGAVVTGSVDYYGNDGKTLRVHGDGATLNLFGGSFQAMNDTYTAYGTDTDNASGSATVAIRGGTLNMYEGATIVGVDGKAGNTSKYGGAVYVHNANNPVFNMYGGTICNGVATNGGNVCVLQSKAVFNLYGGEILGGTGTYGGNVYVHSAGSTTYGTMNMSGGFIAGGKATNVNYGNNVYLGTYKSGDVTYCTAVFAMSGGTIVGDVCGGYGTGSNRVVNLSGSAKIVTKAMHNDRLYNGTAGLVRCSFTLANLGEGSDVWSGQGLAESYGYCSVCKAAKKWTTISAPQTMTAGSHYRLKADLAYTYETETDSSFLSGAGCFDLNGCDLTIDGGRFLLAQTKNSTVNIFDSFGGAVITGSNDYYSEGGMVIRTNAAGAKVNLYGGTYKAMEDTATTEGRENANSPMIRMRDGGEINLYEGATIDGSDLTRTCAAIFMGYSASNPTIFNIEGGTVIGCTNTSAEGIGGAFRVGNGAGDAVLNLRSGMIIGGDSRLGDAISIRPGNTFNMYGGLVAGGENSSDTLIYVQKLFGTATVGGSANIADGVIVGNLYVEETAEISLSGSGTVYGIDHGNDDYTSYNSIAIEGDVEVAAEMVDPITGDRYIALADENGYGFHRINVQLTAVTLRTAQAGLYYKAQYECDDVVAGMVDKYGVVLSLNNMPGADFAEEQADINRATACGVPFASGVEATSGSVFGIMKAGNRDNAARGELKIYANAYITLYNGTVIVADTTSGDKCDAESFDGAAWSLHDVMNAIDGDFASLSAEEQLDVNNFYAQWKEDGMQDWSFTNIGVV